MKSCYWSTIHYEKMEVTFRMAEEEYVKDLYNIGIIVLTSSFIGVGIIALAVVIGAIFGGSLRFGITDAGVFAIGCQQLAGFLIIGYIAWKYHYKKAVKGEV